MRSKNCRILFVILTCLNFFIYECKHLIQSRTNNSQNRLQGKIVNGKVVDIEKYPYAVQFINMGRLCGGVILHSWAIATAAHCLDFSSSTLKMLIQTGAKYAYDHNAEKYNVSSFVIHEDYNKKQVFSCDIALVFPEKPIKFGERAKKAILVDHDKWMVETETNFTVTGWGYTQEDGAVSKVGLQMTTLRYVPPEKCSELHDDHTLTEDMFCLYGGGTTDTCQGDSGGGVLWNDVLVGLTSHGNGCAQKGRPSVYANLWVLRKWIKDRILEFQNTYCIEKLRLKANIGTKAKVDLS